MVNLPSSIEGSPAPRGLTTDAFDLKAFRASVETVVQKLESYLADTSIRGLDLIPPESLTRAARALMTGNSAAGGLDQDRLAEIVDLYIRTGIQVHSPGYMGRQFSGVVPLAGVIDFVSSVINQPSSFYEAGQLPNVVEQIMADELNGFIGWPAERFRMVTTSGGSLANLTALLAARNQKFPGFWRDGVAAFDGMTRPAIAVGEDAHYSISRAAGIMGIGEAQIVRLPVNENRQIRPDLVRPCLAAAQQRGLTVFALVATAGTTQVGAFDPIDELADIAHEQNIWLHVDGAHGASLLLSDKLRHKLDGIEKVDSLTWDAHKMMFVPAPCTLLFYRNRDDGDRPFRQTASYVFDETLDIYTALDSGARNLECTKRPMIMTLWTLWVLYGPALFAEKIEYLCQLTQEAYQVLQADAEFETVHRPEGNILCFRYRPAAMPAGAVHHAQVTIRDKIKKRGRFFISKVDIDDTAALRVVMMNHEITVEHFRMLLDEIRDAGRELGGIVDDSAEEEAGTRVGR
jgi:L-2,4-diaminobutyrate decarboxylase